MTRPKHAHGPPCIRPQLGVAFAGAEAKDCGMLDTRSGMLSRSIMRSCATKALKSTKPFRFGYGVVGHDSGFCNVAVRTSDGQLWAINLDYDAAIPGGPSVSVSQCKTLSFAPENEFFELKQCVQDSKGFDLLKLSLEDDNK